jgi:glycosyltransferase involved in cell wall biosynthesis
MINKDKNPKRHVKLPFVSICTPTFNRRPFIPIIIKCFEHQNYPKDKIEWIIIDDGTDKIEDLVTHIPQVKYFKYNEKMTLGKKRNLLNDKAKGDIIVYMDDDDYYPPERVSHAVDSLINSKALCAGSSAMFIYFKHINKMIQFGPYGPNHSTAATFAFKRELLSKTRFDESSAVAEEKIFLQDYKIPFVQLETKKSILVFSHNHNSFDKKELLIQGPNPNMRESIITPADLVKEPEILKFFMEDIDKLLDTYEPGKIEHKPDVTKQLAEIKEYRNNLIKQYNIQQTEYNNTINKINMMNPQNLQNTINQQSLIIQQLSIENGKLKEQVQYFENKIKQFINEKIEEKNNKKILDEKIQEKHINLSNLGPAIA